MNLNPGASMGMMGGINPAMMMNPAMMGMAGDMQAMFAQGMGGMGGMGMPAPAMPGMGGMPGGGGMGGGPAGPMVPPGGPAAGGQLVSGDPTGDGKYYKTKICHRFMEGKCNYGPTCKYAHGESDLRPGPGGGGSGGSGSQRNGGGSGGNKMMMPLGGAGSGGMMGGGGSGGPPMGGGPMGAGGGLMGMPGNPLMMGGMGAGMQQALGGLGGMQAGGMGMLPGGLGMMPPGGGMQQQQQIPGPKPPPGGGMMGGGMGSGGEGKGTHWRTRLCEQFMKEGACRYGNNCTFAHGHDQLRRPGPGGGQGGGGGGGRSNQQGGQKRGLEQQQGGGGEKRARVQQQQPQQPVVPPEHESLPVEGAPGSDVDAVRARFQALVQEANRFARDTGHSVALFTVGGVLSNSEDTTDMAGDSYVVDVKSKDSGAPLSGLKVCVLKHGTGGVSQQLATRGEIIKFVSARGSKALGEMAAQAEAEESARGRDEA